jgi:thymidylate synthase (FAD)
VTFNDGPQVFLVARTTPDLAAMNAYLEAVGGGADSWMHSHDEPRSHPQDLVEFAGRLCYRSWVEGLNPNVTKIRTDQGDYLRNILKQSHGSVLEHVTFSFVFHNVSRVFTHELITHRAGTAKSQESMRYVRLEDIPINLPEWAMQDEELMSYLHPALSRLEWLQKWMADHFRLDDPGVPFSQKKKFTSFMRRFAPDGVSTGVLWTANIRALRHVIEARTAPGAEEEMRLVFSKVAAIMTQEAPALFSDFSPHEDGSWVPEWSKV